MSTKLGITSLIVGGYLMAMGIAGINVNADSGGAQAVFSLVLVIGLVIAGWSVMLPWDGGEAHSLSQTPVEPVSESMTPGPVDHG